MTEPEAQKSSYDEYMFWTQVVIDRLTTVAHVYGKPPFPDVFFPEGERQIKVEQAVDLLRRLHALTDESDFEAARGAMRAEREESVIETILPLFRDVLRRLPEWSSDMQLLLKSPWYDKCGGKLAGELFRGPEGRLAEGIGSGMTDHGRLPQTLQNLLERESMGDTRAPNEEKPPAGDVNLKREELARLWARHNTSFLRSAGRVD
ncbi:MAG: hypothetical protein HGA90_01115 [Alphaproteobacteria bacterium]|nr:hypothetical protein [Alphaproteobacteria bacterium]